MIDDLFQEHLPNLPERQRLGPGSLLIRHQLQAVAPHLMDDIQALTLKHPLRHMVTRGGHPMSVATSSCGPYGWVSDARHGYRYATIDPHTGLPWPPIPAHWQALAASLAAQAGYERFEPDSALINCYAAGSRMGLHQDRDEATLDCPIVSLSLGITANFMFGGLSRQDPVSDVPLMHGDVVVWGGADRLRFHGIRPLKDGYHPLTGHHRYNITFRRVQP